MWMASRIACGSGLDRSPSTSPASGSGFGVSIADGDAVFDEAAPLAAVRRAITAPPAGTRGSVRRAGIPSWRT
jgi:hypothetical protein